MASDVPQTIPFSIDALLQAAGVAEENDFKSIKKFLTWAKVNQNTLDDLTKESLKELVVEYNENFFKNIDEKFTLGLYVGKILQAASHWIKEKAPFRKKKPTLKEILDACNVTQNVGKLPELQNFISRGKETEETIRKFIQRNTKNFPYTEKQKYSFLYAIGGSGYGKTWIGKYVPTKIQQYYPETKVIWILLDFSNGDAIHSSIDKDHNNRDLDEAVARVSLGFRVAARFLFKKNASSALGELKAHEFAVDNTFRIEFVIPQIRENLGLASNDRLHICLQFDEPQMAPELVQKLLHAVGSFSVNIAGASEAQLQNTIIFPVITGTSSKNIKQQVTFYSHTHIQLTPFSFLDSRQLLNKMCPNLTPWNKLGEFWNRIIMSAGGLPRLLSLLAEQIGCFEEKEPNLQVLLHNWVDIIESNYKVSEWTLRFGGVDNMRTIIEWALLRKPVSKDTAVGDRTVEDIMLEGVIFLAPGKHFVDLTQTTYYIMFPQILLWLINSKYHFITEQNVLNPIDDSWNWNVFESFENQWDSLKGNLYVKTGTNKISFGKYYSSVVTPQEYEHFEFMLQRTTVVIEQKQFLPKNGIAAVPDEIETNQGPIPKAEWFDYAFRCAPGNPQIDSRIFRRATDGGLDWMICKQAKHTATGNPMDLSTIKKDFWEFKNKIGHYKSHFRVLYVLVTNQPLKNDNDTGIFQKADGVILVTGNDLMEYTSPSLYNYFMYEKEPNESHVEDELDGTELVDIESEEPSNKRQKTD